MLTTHLKNHDKPAKTALVKTEMAKKEKEVIKIEHANLEHLDSGDFKCIGKGNSGI
jgi:hypothetical protein